MTEEQTVTRERCDLMTERTERRLEKHGETIDELKTCTVKLTEMLAVHNEKLSDYGARLITLESRPGRLLDRVGTALISALATAAVALLLALI